MNKKNSSKTAIPTRRKIALVILGLILSLALLEAGFRLGGFVQLSLQEYGNLQSAKQKGTYRILCLGDSMTYMQYPHLLDQVLNQRNIGVRFSVIGKGGGGASFSVILSRVESYLAEYHPDMVVTMMGFDMKGFDQFQNISENDTWICRHCLLYRFVRMRFMHFLEKIKHENIYGLSGSHPGRKAEPESAGTVPERANLSNEAPAQKVALADLRRAMGTRGPTSSNLNGGRISKTEGSLKKAIELHPENDMAYVESGGLYKNQGKFSQAEDSYRKAIEINPLNARAYIGLGRLYEDQGKFSQAEESFKKAIEIYPKNDMAYAGLGELYMNSGKFSQAEDAFKKAVELNPENAYYQITMGGIYRRQGKFPQAEDAYKQAVKLKPADEFALVELGKLYREQGKFSQARDSFKNALELNPKNDWAYVALGELYRDHNDFSLACDSFRKALELNPKNENAYAELGSLYRQPDKLPQAEEIYKKAVELNPANDRALFALARTYLNQGKFSQAENSYKKVIELNPANDFALVDLGGLYRNQGRFHEAEDLFKKALVTIPQDERIFGAMALLYKEMGNPELANEYAEKIHQVGLEDTVIANNYRKLKEILDRKGIKLVCVQYPMRNVGLLKRIFENDKDVIFVDNERVFKNAVKRSGFKEYFRDMSAGDFGHCTAKGNMLLAQNIADVILREVFKKS
jgi:tetratricopeptide (TPR) repeat protein